MKKAVLIILSAIVFGGSMMAASGETSAETSAETIVPAKISKSELGGKIFERPDMAERTHGDGHVTQSVTTLLSADKNFSSGMYKSGKTRIEVTKPYGVDEFMYFLEGGVTLTSSDGTELVINAGEAVTVPKEWTGVFETDGYMKIWVIYAKSE